MTERSVRFFRSGLLLAAVTIGQAASAQPVGKWVAAGDGNWGDAQNWDIQPNVPNGPTAEARFVNSGANSSERLVTINTPVQINKLVFDVSNASNAQPRYRLGLGAGQSFKFSGTSNEINIPETNLMAHRIEAPFEISNSDLTITNSSRSNLYVKGGITESGGARKLILQGGGPIELDDETNNHSGGTRAGFALLKTY